ncbi:MAG: nucleotide exchange factor GrpE [Gemmataceae bacterium]
MNDDLIPETLPARSAPAPRPDHTLGASTSYRLCEEMIALREANQRQHKMFEQHLSRTRDALQSSFNNFAADTQRAFQQLRQELHGEKRVSLALMYELVEIALDLEQIVAAQPPLPEEAAGRWAEAVAVQSRKVRAALQRHGIHRFDAVIGTPYQPALHERVGGVHLEGMEPARIAEQREPGYASQQPDFILRRPKVIVSE